MARQPFFVFPRKVQPSDDSTASERSKVRVNEQADRLVMYGLLAFGLFIPRHFSNVGGSKWVVFAFYYAVTFAVLAANALRVIATIRDPGDDFDVFTFVKIALVLWMLVVVSNYIYMALICLLPRNAMSGYYKQLGEVKNSLTKLQPISDSPEKLDLSRFITVSCIAIGWLGSFGCAAYSLPQLWHPEIRKQYSAYLKLNPGNYSSTPEELGYVANLLQGLAFAVGSGAYFWPAIQKIVVCLQLAHLLHCFRRLVKRAATADPEAFITNISSYRDASRHIRRTVKAANKCFGAAALLDILYQLFTTMIALYAALWSSTIRASADFFAMFCMFTAVLFGVLIMETLSAASIASQADECIESLLALKTSSLNVSIGSAIEVNLLLTEMQRPIGIEPFGIFMINKEAVVAIVGTWLTYFLIILSFNPQPD